ncbi:MAG: hypothetical protein HYY04_16555 [Chloroflexi bacterium]|nr:hypothetical protein [Chloroflexota bacterium]
MTTDEASTATPHDEFTPHGYLDNPHHSWRLGQSGVLRSVDGLGFAWHFPSYPGPYGRSWVSTATLRVGLRLAGQLLLTAADFASVGLDLVAREHTKNVFQFVLRTPISDCRSQTDSVITVTFLLAGADALLACVKAQPLLTAATRHLTPDPHSPTPTPHLPELWLIVEYRRNLGASGLWDFGLFGRSESPRQIHLGCFAEGPHLALVSPAPAEQAGVWVGDLDGEPPALLPAATVSRWETNPARLGGALIVPLPLTPGEGEERRYSGATFPDYQSPTSNPQSLAQWVALGRGASGRAAYEAAEAALAVAEATLATRRAEDATFWEGAPRLAGDWPDHWRRGLVYDFETLRMIVRPPRGRFRRPWDGMQVQVPRVVLAETALDMLALSYAAPSLAQEVILGTFEGALAPNLPCCREDGSVNMVAADGSECGTSPAWGWPFVAVESIDRRTGDRQWLARLYPFLCAFLDWWLAHRTDEEGWAIFRCGWESGQDESPRFGKVPHGGVDIGHLRPVELQAAVAHAAGVLARGASALGDAAEATRWRAVAADYADRTRRLFVGDRFADFDVRAGQFSDVREPVHLAPALCGVATAAQLAALRPLLHALPAHGEWTALEWPPVAFTILESAWAMGERALAAELSSQLLERIDRAMDARESGPEGPLPGIASEHWPPSGDWGTEGYGWGALGCVFLLRNVVGWRETEDGFVLAPCLPSALRVPGRRYLIRGLRAGPARLDVTIEPCPEEERGAGDDGGGERREEGGANERQRVTLDVSCPTPVALTISGPSGVVDRREPATRHQAAWVIAYGELRTLRLK